ncbi:MAG: sugar-binding protein [Bacteroidota bacterium]|nr:sugar-binding protein [Bacteroidota bacterium]
MRYLIIDNDELDFNFSNSENLKSNNMIKIILSMLIYDTFKNNYFKNDLKNNLPSDYIYLKGALYSESCIFLNDSIVDVGIKKINVISFLEKLYEKNITSLIEYYLTENLEIKDFKLFYNEKFYLKAPFPSFLNILKCEFNRRKYDIGNIKKYPDLIDNNSKLDISFGWSVNYYNGVKYLASEEIINGNLLCIYYFPSSSKYFFINAKCNSKVFSTDIFSFLAVKNANKIKEIETSKDIFIALDSQIVIDSSSSFRFLQAQLIKLGKCALLANNIELFVKIKEKYMASNFAHAELFEVLTKLPYAEIINLGNYSNRAIMFEVDSIAKYRILFLGEGHKKNFKNISCEFRDNIELYFDLSNKKRHKFSLENNNILYRFCYESQMPVGLFKKNANINFKFAKKSINSKAIEIFIPWETLEFNMPIIDTVVGFDIKISDNDGVGFEKLFGWEDLHCSNNSADIIANASCFGELKLSNSLLRNIKLGKVGRYTSYFSKDKVRIDGNVDLIWEKVASQDISKVLMGRLYAKDDFNGSFKSFWNNEGLYFLILIQDKEYNFLEEEEFDYAYIIEENTKKVVWKSSVKNSILIGGKSNIFIDTTLELGRGKYKIVYLSDNSHSEEGWMDHCPMLPFYGIKLFKNDIKIK